MDYLIYLLPVPIMLLWLAGGQFSKGARRWGVPGITTTVYILNRLFTDKDKREKNEAKNREYIAMFFYMVLTPLILSLGYGENSWLRRLVEKVTGWDTHGAKNDLTTRATYGTMLSLPILVYVLLTAVSPWRYLVIVVALVLAFLVRAGSLGKIGKYDILIEDIVRSLTFGGSLVFVLV
jgi:hypothetical protein